MGAPYKAVDVAEYLLKRASGPMSSFKLQKILYYAQAWSLALRDRPLFNEPIEAWVNGPVCYSVFDRHRRKYAVRTVSGDAAAVTDASDQDFLVSVFKAYDQFDADALVRMTHAEAPWREARGGQGPREHGHAIITQESMRDFYLALSRNPAAREIH